jgi:hypothetical protein
MRPNFYNLSDLVGRTIFFKRQAWSVAAISEDGSTLALERGTTKGKLQARQLDETQLYPTFEEVERRYPRLIRAAQNAAILSHTEAVEALVGHLVNGRFSISSEAVAHFGGSARVIEQAFLYRHKFKCQLHLEGTSAK